MKFLNFTFIFGDIKLFHEFHIRCGGEGICISVPLSQRAFQGGLCLRNIIFKKETYAFHIFFNRIFIYRIKIIGANYIISFLSDIKIQHESSDERD